MKHVINKIRKINSVSGNIKYLADKKEHPDICYTYSTCANELWREYAAENQKAFKASGNANDPEKKCVEAHENVYIFPEEFYRLSLEEQKHIAEEIAEDFKKRHGVEVMIGLHGKDKDCKNLHVHLMYMERKKEIKEPKIASRRLYFNDKGRQVHTRKDALDPDGNLLPGYYFVKKGEVYGEKEWTSKNHYLKSNKFVADEKAWWADYINKYRERDELSDMDKRIVYDKETSPYLPLQDEKKPLKYRDFNKQLDSDLKAVELYSDIVFSNDLRREYNSKVDQALDDGESLQDLVDLRKELSAEIKEAVDNQETHKIDEIIYKRTNWFEVFLKRLKQAKNSLENILKTARDKLYSNRSEEHSKSSEPVRKRSEDRSR